jgi:tRNA A-37 threonylcarbamoyl transferase component Bud32
MPLRIVATKPNPALVTLPWSQPLEDWDDEFVVPLPRGISRHVVRIVRLGDDVYAVKETREAMAVREYRMLRDLQRMGLPTVDPIGVVHGRETADGEEIEPCLVTRHLTYSLPYRSLFSHGLRADSLPKLIDALAVLLVRLHLAGFFWGDVSLSNVLFRRSAGEFAAYLVDAETGELHPSLSEGQRNYDLTVAYENLYGELLDLQAGGLLDEQVDPDEIVELIETRYDALWQELTGTEEFDASEMWRMERRIEHLNELGFDVDELDIVTDLQGSTVRLQPKVVEAGHHSRELQGLTGLDVEDNQARRLLNDIASFCSHVELHGEERAIVAQRWLNEVYEPTIAMVPSGLRGKLEPAEMFHEILEHRWYLSERAGREVSTKRAARSYIENELAKRPDEAITGSDDPDVLMPQPGTETAVPVPQPETETAVPVPPPDPPADPRGGQRDGSPTT